MSVFEIFTTILSIFYGAACWAQHSKSEKKLAIGLSGNAKEEEKMKSGCAAILFLLCAAWVIAVVGSRLWTWVFPC